MSIYIYIYIYTPTATSQNITPQGSDSNSWGLMRILNRIQAASLDSFGQQWFVCTTLVGFRGGRVPLLIAMRGACSTSPWRSSADQLLASGCLLVGVAPVWCNVGRALCFLIAVCLTLCKPAGWLDSPRAPSASRFRHVYPHMGSTDPSPYSVAGNWLLLW